MKIKRVSRKATEKLAWQSRAFVVLKLMLYGNAYKSKNMKNKNPTRCHLLFYCASDRLNMFRALLCPSSGARDYDVDYHIGRFVLGYSL